MFHTTLKSMIDAQPVSGAWLSDCGVYRYALWRIWDKALPILVVCMLNPSTADASKNDPTARRVIFFAKREGYGGVLVVNLSPYRATDPKALKAAENRMGGPEGEFAIHWAAGLAVAQGRPILCAWGANAILNPQWTIQKFRSMGAGMACLGTTAAGHPRHPLYVRGDQPMVEFAP